MARADCFPVLCKDEGQKEEGTPSDPHLLSLRRVFDACDENRDAFLTLEELCAWMNKLGLHLSREGLRDIVQTCDRNLDGRLDFDEFISLTAHLNIGSSPPPAVDRDVEDTVDEDAVTDDPQSAGSELREAFLVFDKDGDGVISASELRSTLSQLGLLAASTSFSRIRSMIRKVDTDGDGEVSFTEFESMMKGV